MVEVEYEVLNIANPRVEEFMNMHGGPSALREVSEDVHGHHAVIWNTKEGTPEYNTNQYIVLSGITAMLGTNPAEFPHYLGGRGIGIDSSAAVPTLNHGRYVEEPSTQAATMMPLIEQAAFDKNQSVIMAGNSLATRYQPELTKQLVDNGYKKIHVILDSPVGVDEVGMVDIAQRFTRIQAPFFDNKNINWVVEAVWPNAATVAVAETGMNYLHEVRDQRPLNFTEKRDLVFYETILQKTQQAKETDPYAKLPLTPEQRDELKNNDSWIEGFMSLHPDIVNRVMGAQKEFALARLKGETPPLPSWTEPEKLFMKYLQEYRGRRNKILLGEALELTGGMSDGVWSTTYKNLEFSKDGWKHLVESRGELKQLMQNLSEAITLEDIYELQNYVETKNQELPDDEKVDVDFSVIAPSHDPFSSERTSQTNEEMEALGIHVFPLNYGTHYSFSGTPERTAQNIKEIVAFLESKTPDILQAA